MKSTRTGLFGRICLGGLFSYLVIAGCSDPVALVDPIHLTFVPNVQQLQAAVGTTPGGKRRVVLTWRFDTLNANIRTWDIQRAVNDTLSSLLTFFEIVRKPDFGYPIFIDSSTAFQNMEVDSLDVYYRVVPNGDTRNYIGEPSDILHVLVRRFL